MAPHAAATASLATYFFSCCLIFLNITATSRSLIPPLGNSIALSATTKNGKVTYSCNNGKWAPVSISAKLVATGRHSTQKEVGSYSRNFSMASQSVDDNYDVGTWSLLNNDGDAAESGHISSQVAGKLISTIPKDNSETYLRAFLAQASHHQFEGEAARVSYIMQTRATRGALPAGSCTYTKELTVNVTFEAHFKLWKQDVVPPAMMPPPIAVDNNREMLLEAFFAVGAVAYEAGNATWEMQSAEGRLFDVPGGADLGSCHLQGNFYKSKDLTLCLFLKGATPSEDASTCAKPSMPNGGPVVVDPHSFPWSLMSVSNTTGNLTNFGVIPSSIQMVSTFGGLGPSLPPFTSKNSYESNLTAIFWIYTRQS